MSHRRSRRLSSRAAWLIVAAAGLAPLAFAQRSVRTRSPVPVGGTFEIVSCSLGCVPVSPGHMGCTTSEIHVNEELRVTFNRPVAPSSVTNNTFRVIDNTGRTPPARFALDPHDPNTLLWRPQLTFDSAGNPIFGLEPGRTYLLSIPSRALAPVVLTSVDGLPNETSLMCVLVASLGVADVVPGQPLVKLYVDVVTARDPVSGEPTAFATVPAQGATEVYCESPIRLVFPD